MRCIQGLVACAIKASGDPPYAACNHSVNEANRFFNCRLLFVGFLLSLSCSSFFRMTFTFCLKIVKKISHFAQLDFFRQIAMFVEISFIVTKEFSYLECLRSEGESPVPGCTGSL